MKFGSVVHEEIQCELLGTPLLPSDDELVNTLVERAVEFADRLVVGVNTDRSARALAKGPGRPLVSENDRAALVAGFSTVDAVVLFDEDTPYELLKALKPDVLVKGADYKLEDIVGREFAKRVERIELAKGFATSSLIRKIREY